MVIVKTELDLLVRFESEARVLLKQLLLYECTRWESCVYARDNQFIIDHMMSWDIFHLPSYGSRTQRQTPKKYNCSDLDGLQLAGESLQLEPKNVHTSQ